MAQLVGLWWAGERRLQPERLADHSRPRHYQHSFRRLPLQRGGEPGSGAAPRAKVAFRETDPCVDGTASDVATSGSASSDSDTNDINTIDLDSGAGLTESGAFGEQGEQAEQGSATVQYSQAVQGAAGEQAEPSHCHDDDAQTEQNGRSDDYDESARGENGDLHGSDRPATLSPCPQEPADARSISEKQAGILRAVFEAAARQPSTPTMGGAAPTVLVHININDLLAGRGAGWIDDIDNAVLLCNPAHASIETSGWDIDMRDGRRWLRGPLLFDPTQTWRPGGQNRAASPAEKPNWEK